MPRCELLQLAGQINAFPSCQGRNEPQGDCCCYDKPLSHMFKSAQIRTSFSTTSGSVMKMRVSLVMPDTH